MKKLLLGALLVVGSMSYGATTSAKVTITANVKATGTIEIRQGEQKVETLDYSDGKEKVLDVVFTSTNKTTLQKVTAKNITMENGVSGENFLISVDAKNNSVTLAGQDMTIVNDGIFKGDLIVIAEYL